MKPLDTVQRQKLGPAESPQPRPWASLRRLPSGGGWLLLAALAVNGSCRGPDDVTEMAGASDSLQLARVDQEPGLDVPARPAAMPTRPEGPTADPGLLARQMAAYHEPRPKSVIDLQPYRSTDTIPIKSEASRVGTATLINLNPTVNAWYLLELRWADQATATSYHLENTRPAQQELVLDPSHPLGIVAATSNDRTPCDLWSPAASFPLDVAAASPAPYVPLCGGHVLLRQATQGRRTTVERVTDFLRDHAWSGEQLTVLVRTMFFQDAFLQRRELTTATAPGAQPEPSAPRPARLDSAYLDSEVTPTLLGIALADHPDGTFRIGRWHVAEGNPGIFVSLIEPSVVARDILNNPDRVSALDAVEAGALVYLVAFDLHQFDVGFALGTDHPRVAWSPRPPPEAQDETLPGPDGIATVAPLVGTGIVRPSAAEGIAATFAGGFKRTHGAFRYGDLAFENHGTHYGFVEQGTVLSKLQPGLSTLVVYDDDTVEMKTWTVDDAARLRHVKFARQNGVPLIERDVAAGSGRPGELVGRWGPGNWSGSQDGDLRSVRGGACLQEEGDRRFLIYGFFSSATPSAMARVFQAYECSHAMLLDMNALEHTYLALYRVLNGDLKVEHVIKGMDVLDTRDGDNVLPRFLGLSDNRDFFYLVRRAAPGAEP